MLLTDLQKKKMYINIYRNYFDPFAIISVEQSIGQVVQILTKLNVIRFDIHINDPQLNDDEMWEIVPDVFRSTHKLQPAVAPKTSMDRGGVKKKKPSKRGSKNVDGGGGAGAVTRKGSKTASRRKTKKPRPVRLKTNPDALEQEEAVMYIII